MNLVALLDQENILWHKRAVVRELRVHLLLCQTRPAPQQRAGGAIALGFSLMMFCTFQLCNNGSFTHYIFCCYGNILLM